MLNDLKMLRGLYNAAGVGAGLTIISWANAGIFNFFTF